MDPTEDGISAVDAPSSIEALLGDDLDMLDDENQGTDPVEVKEEKVEADPEAVEPEEDDEKDPDAEDEEDESEEDDSDKDPQPAITDDTLVDIKIGDDEYEVNFLELKSGYLRNEDYVNKVNAHEAEYLEKSVKIEQLEADLIEELQHVSVIVTGDLSKYDRINWAALKEADPAQYNALRVEATEAREQAAALIERRAAIQKMHQKAQELRHQAYLKSQIEIAEKIVPGFRDPAFFQALVSHGKDIGYTEEEVQGISDARQLFLLNNSRLYAESQVRKKSAMDNKVTPDLPPVVKPGAVKEKSSTDRRVVKNAKAVFQRDKSVDSAAALLMTLDL
jgi:hypothetical protein